ncbi:MULTISPECIES: hypothetical protein [unclassified Sporosarcina]|uniref:hypothetical protein n=1 Tax=unclassified Sporosarcina TaxID=2647733 RepID=UPI001A926B81|nr:MULTISPECIES: hypothetical protein [unclassified Sporosarcina]MBO0588155.1 hypothetical protein [Sporosarcina sp. E16_8]MBO0601910.1 hypothetical protein [Sporosarcina sp. E16_3]
MKSVNINIAYQVRTALVENIETQNALRGLPETSITLFFRNNELQKVSFDDVCYNLIGNSFDDEFEGIPTHVYKNLCTMIYNEIKDLNMDLNYRSIVIGWKYDASSEAYIDTSFVVRKEVHFSRM